MRISKDTATPIALRFAFTSAIDYSGGSIGHKERQRGFARRLCDYFEGQGLQSVDQLRSKHVRQFVMHSIERGHSPNTIRQGTNPVRLVNNWLLDEHDVEHQIPVGRHLRDLAPRRAPDHHFLTLPQLLEAIASSDTNDKQPAKLVFLACGLAGLRITELERLRWEDLKGDTIAIQGETKNDASRRIIPVLPMVMEALQDHYEHFNGGGRWGGGVGMWTYRTMHANTRIMLNLLTQTTGEDRYSKCTPHQAGRTTFENIMHTLKIGFEKESWELRDAYTGRAPRIVRQRYYASAAARPKQHAEINAEKIDAMRKAVVEPLAAEIEKIRSAM